MPGGKHLRGATPKQNRMYEAIKKGYLKRGLKLATAKRRAAMTVNAIKARPRRRR